MAAPRPPDLKRLPSVELRKMWSSVGEEDILPEYQNATKMNCLDRKLLTTSDLSAIMNKLDKLLKITPEKPAEIDSDIIKCIKKAYHLDSDDKAKTQKCLIHGGNIFNPTKSCYTNFKWRKKYLQAALRQGAKTIPDGLLVGILAELRQGGSTCMGRKRFAFNMLLRALTFDEDKEELEIKENKENKEEDPLAVAKKSLYDFIRDFIEDYKTKAYNLSTVEVLKFYFFASSGNHKQTIEMHSSNMFATIYYAALGIRVPIGYMDDSQISGSLVEFLECKEESFTKGLKILLNPDNLGREFSSIPELKGLKIKKKLRTSRFYFKGKTPREKAIEASDPKEENRENREKLSKYLENFMMFFKAEIVVEKILSVINQNRRDEMQIVYKSMYPNATGEDADYRTWAWDIIEGTFNLDRGIELLTAIGGIMKQQVNK